MSAQIFDFLAIREQTRRVMAGEQPRRLDWQTPPSLTDAEAYTEAGRAWRKRHDKPTDPKDAA